MISYIVISNASTLYLAESLENSAPRVTKKWKIVCHTDLIRHISYSSNLTTVKSVVIADKTFNATVFLTKVHRGTSFKDIELGAQNLRASCERQSEVMKNLVKKHFAKFVTAKGNIDGFYQQMRSQNLVSKTDYGITPYEKTLEGMPLVYHDWMCLKITFSLVTNIGKLISASLGAKN